jgi:hypothetical protein
VVEPTPSPMGVAKAFGNGFGHPHFLFGGGRTTPFRIWEWLNHPFYFFKKKINAFIFLKSFIIFSFFFQVFLMYKTHVNT